MTIVPGDLLKIKRGIIVHRVDCTGKFHGQLSQKITRLWPKVRDLYLHKFKKNGWSLGDTQIINVGDPGQNLYIANCASKFGIRKGEVQTEYSAVKTCFENLAFQRLSLTKGLPVYIPYGYGCDPEGSDWHIIITIIESIIPDISVVSLGKPAEMDEGTFRCLRTPFRDPEADETTDSCHPETDQVST